MRVGIDGVGERIVTAALEIRPVEIALDAEHQHVDLPIGADLAAADEPGLVERIVRAGKRVAPRGIGEARAEIAADINPRLIVNRRRIDDRRHHGGRAGWRQIGGLRRSNAKASRNASRKNRAGGKGNAADERTRIHARPPASIPDIYAPRRGASYRAPRCRSSWTKHGRVMAG